MNRCPPAVANAHLAQNLHENSKTRHTSLVLGASIQTLVCSATPGPMTWLR